MNMSAAELRDWLATVASKRVGWKGMDGSSAKAAATRAAA